MPLREKVNHDLTAAMKGRDAVRLAVLRMMKTAIRNREVELRAEPDDAQILQVLKTLVNQRRDSIELFLRGGRQDLAVKEEAEIAVIMEYLPREASPEEIEGVVTLVISELGARSPKDMGKVMKECLARLTGRLVDGRKVSETVMNRLREGN